MALLAGGVALYAIRDGVRSWRRRERQAAIGAFLLAVATVVLPIVLTMIGE
jgi:hypothetical protein